MQNGLFNVTEEQQSLVELIRDFMTKEIKPACAGMGKRRPLSTGDHRTGY